MSEWRFCGNCGDRKCAQRQADERVPADWFDACDYWEKLPCPSCGGTLSEIRTDGKKRWRHCFSCHFEFEEKMNERANI